MRFNVITIFPEMFDSYLQESIIGRAIKEKKIKILFYNPRDFIKAPKNNYKPVDDKPYGGGPGMVMRAEPMLKAIEKALKICSRSGFPATQRQPFTKTHLQRQKIKIILFSPSGKKFDTSYAKKSAKKYTDIILISGRYEGIDARVQKILKAEEISIGDYVLTGGELPAMVLIDSISRQIPGVLGKYESLEEERISSSEVYTRPEILKWKNKNYKVPKVLLSGNHKLIDEWKKGKFKTYSSSATRHSHTQPGRSHQDLR
ncbi:MAG TPA: tRNA (guanosine(37)-N1)-methyltransferase TrmD [Candidatus Paceibacterota bacterium]|nr:tRNA (guanosine(37)-N1)-methyltransferase TrmD [Candidatus Paceibacterota bacterium]